MECPPSPETASKTCARSSPTSVSPAADRPPRRQSEPPCGDHRMLMLTDTAADKLADARTGKNGRHRLAGLLRQAVFGRLAGYEDLNDAERLCRDPAMRWVVGEKAITGYAASASQMGRFETEWLCRPENLVALA